MAEAATTVVPANIRAAATLRYFSGEGEFARAAAAATGGPLPAPLKARESGGEAPGVILAWRSPRETLCLAQDPAALTALAARLKHVTDGCMVELTGGLAVLRVTAADAGAGLIARLGDVRVAPGVGEAKRGRLADIAVLAIRVRAGETLLVVDRALLPHLMGWIQATLDDAATA